MAQCWRCNHSGGKHNEACPEGMSGAQKAQAKEFYDKGYRQGRGGKQLADPNPSYNLGYLRGVVALEEAENGEPFSDAADFNDDCRDEITEGEND